jgi:hypothetical protein
LDRNCNLIGRNDYASWFSVFYWTEFWHRFPVGGIIRHIICYLPINGKKSTFYSRRAFIYDHQPNFFKYILGILCLLLEEPFSDFLMLVGWSCWFRQWLPTFSMVIAWLCHTTHARHKVSLSFAQDRFDCYFSLLF